MTERKISIQKVDLDSIMDELGHFGRYQIRVYSYLMVAIITKAMYNTQYVFAAGPVEYRCRVPECETYPLDFAAKKWGKFALPGNRKCHRKVPTGGGCSADSFSNTTIKCSSWVYKNNNTIVPEFDLACQDWKRTLVGTVHSFAYFTAIPVTAYISDKYGRRLTLICTAIAPAFVGIARSFCTNYYVYLVLEYIEAFVGIGSYSTAFILGLEMVNLKKRVQAGIALSMTYASGQAILGITASIVPYWRHLTRLIYAPSVLFIFYFLIVEESVRWLIVKGRKEEAARIIIKAAEINGRTLSPQAIAMLEQSDEEPRYGIQANVGERRITVTKPEEVPICKQVLKSKTMMFRLTVCSFYWVTVTMVYYGLSINSVMLAGNRYVNFVLTALIEIPATHIIGMTMMGKMCISMIFCSIYIYTIELFPTQARHVLMGICSMVGRVGSMTAPQTPLLAVYMRSLPYILFGSMAGIAGILMLFTPETLKLKLPDTIEEAEHMERPRTRQRTDMLSAN
ncbi:organic cation transporter-like protein [Anticarsia gemmatalis]|uniref:organic cation transporter-like protein n=1 Tax=Anticarsia gemmatalis TaxID=129554 RepID=UPI003F77476C